MDRFIARIATVGMLVLASACGGGSSSSLENIRAGVPDSNSATVNTPHNQSALIGQTADTYLLTWGATSLVNVDVLAVLVTVHAVVQLPPTTHPSSNVYVWGPGNGSALDPLIYKLTVTDNGDGSYGWALEGRDKNAPEAASSYQVLVSGTHTPVVTNGVNDEKHGNGNFLVDWDARAKLPLPPKTANGNYQLQGTAQITYDNRNDDAKVDAIFTNVIDENSGLVVNPTYHYDQPAGADGKFQFSTQADVNNDGIVENTSIESRWKQDGSGRADIQVSGGSVPAGQTGTGTQCWDSSFLSVYETETVPVAGSNAPYNVNSGDSAQCAFADPEYYNG